MSTDLNINDTMTEDILLPEEEYKEPAIEVSNVELTGQATHKVARFDFSIKTNDGFLGVTDCELIQEPEGKMWMTGYAKRRRGIDGNWYWYRLVSIPGRVKKILLPLAIEAYHQTRKISGSWVDSDISLDAFSHEPRITIHNFRETPHYSSVHAVFDAKIDDWIFRSCSIKDPWGWKSIEGPGKWAENLGYFWPIVDFPKSIHRILRSELGIPEPAPEVYEEF